MNLGVSRGPKLRDQAAAVADQSAHIALQFQTSSRALTAQHQVAVEELADTMRVARQTLRAIETLAVVLALVAVAWFLIPDQKAGGPHG